MLWLLDRQYKLPQERQASSDNGESLCDQGFKSSMRPMLNVLWRIAEVTQVVKPCHVADAPPGFMWDARQQMAPRHSVRFSEGSRGVRQVFEDFQQQYQVESIRPERQSQNIRNNQPIGSSGGRGHHDSLRIEINSDKLGIRPSGQPRKHLALSAASVQERLDIELAYQFLDHGEKPSDRIAGDWIRGAIFGLPGSDVGRRHVH